LNRNKLKFKLPNGTPVSLVCLNNGKARAIADLCKAPTSPICITSFQQNFHYLLQITVKADTVHLIFFCALPTAKALAEIKRALTESFETAVDEAVLVIYENKAYALDDAIGCEIKTGIKRGVMPVINALLYC
jgi:hypothetical protein